MVDTISSLASIDYRHDEWGVDVTVGGSQKGLMLPPGLGFNALGDKALAAARNARLPKSYWDWQAMLSANAKGVFPYTPATNLLYGLREALAMLQEQGLEQVFARHARHAEATRQAVARLGPRAAVPRSARVLELADRGPGARGPRCRRAARGHPRALRPVARQRPRQARRPGVPDRSSGRLQRSDARRHPVRHRDGAEATSAFRWPRAASPRRSTISRQGRGPSRQRASAA